MNCDSTTNSASASGPEFEPRSLVIRVADVALPNGRNSVRGLSLATLAAALAACGGGGSGGPAAPPPPPPPPPPNNAPTATDAAGTATEDGDPATGKAVGADEDGDPLTYKVTQNGKYGSLDLADNGDWTYNPDNDNDTVNALAEGAELTDTATIEVSDGEATATATVTITIQGANDAPTGRDSADEVTAGTGDKGKGTVSPADVDDGDTHTFAVGTQTEHGRLSVDEAGNWTYILDEDDKDVMALDEGDTAMDTGTIVITDNNGGTAEVMVNVTIKGVNDPPMGNEKSDQVQKRTDDDGNVIYELKKNPIATAGKEVITKLDLKTMFEDPDDATLSSYRLEGNPTWLKLTVDYGKDGSVTGILTAKAPPGEDKSLDDVKLIATDGDNASGYVFFDVIVDDGNDRIANIKLTNPDGTTNDSKSFEVPENDGSGMVIATLTAVDQDDARHPNGQHTFTFKAEDAKYKAYEDLFEVKATEADPNKWVLKVKNGVMLDHEDPVLRDSKGSIKLEVTAKDGGGSIFTEVITVDIGDNNDAPMVKNKPGNWWVTVDEDLDAKDASAGQWLSFSLETGTDDRALFADEDVGDTLTYSIVSGPAWLEIDGATGALQNKEGMVPKRGVYDVTVQATDKAKEKSDPASFKIAVVLSDDDNDDNADPDIKATGIDIKEDAKKGDKVGSITIEHRDLDVAGIHPWGDLTIVVTATAEINGAVTNLQTYATFTDGKASSNFLDLKKVSETTYDILLGAAAFGANAIDAESYDEVEVTVTAYDGVVTVTDSTTFGSINNTTDGADIADFDFKIDDVNEAPKLVTGTDLSGNSHSTLTAKEISVGQQGGSVQKLYLNLTRLFEDEDEDNNSNDDDDDFTLSASVSNAPWLTMAEHWNSDTESKTRGVVKWEDIKDGRDEISGNTDDVSWGTLTDPRNDDYVLILEVDRTGSDGTGANVKPDLAEIAQDVDGLLTIIATDDDGASSTTKIPVKITDQNLDPMGKAGAGVTISDTTPADKDTITVSFNESVDPDFTGAKKGTPVATIVYVTNETVVGQNNVSTVQAASLGDSARYTVTQGDVGDTIGGRAVYYELFEGSIVKSPNTADTSFPEDILGAVTSAVADRQDPAKIAVTFSTAAMRADDPNDSSKDIVTDQLVASLSPQTSWDKDGLHATPDIKYEWEESVNGRGGWDKITVEDKPVESDTSTQDTVKVTLPKTVEGMYVRLVVTFKDKNGVSERVESEAIKVGAIKTIGVDRSTDNDGNGNTTDPGEVTIPTINTGTGTTTGIPVGRTLRLDLSDVVPSVGSTKVEWMVGTKVVATSSFKVADTNKVADYTVTNDDRGGTIMVRLTNYDDDDAVTSIVSTGSITSVAAPVNSVPIAPKSSVIIDLGAAPAKEGDLETFTAKVPMASYFEDVEGGLTYGFAAPTGWTDQTIGGQTNDKDSLGVFLEQNTGTTDFGDQLLIIDDDTGALNYYTTKSQTHDGNDADGGGNLITSVLTATDKAASNATATVNVQLRIDVEATGVDITPQSYTENTKGATVATLNVLDENDKKHDYGAYTFTVSDDRFEVTRSKTDLSQATLKLKKGVFLDYEAPEVKAGKIKVEVIATPESGNFDAIKNMVEITITNETGDDPPDLSAANKVPGLKDDETDDTDDTKDSTDDDDDDGGTPAPMDPMAAMMSMLDDGIF